MSCSERPPPDVQHKTLSSNKILGREREKKTSLQFPDGKYTYTRLTSPLEAASSEVPHLVMTDRLIRGPLLSALSCRRPSLGISNPAQLILPVQQRRP